MHYGHLYRSGSVTVHALSEKTLDYTQKLTVMYVMLSFMYCPTNARCSLAALVGWALRAA